MHFVTRAALAVIAGGLAMVVLVLVGTVAITTLLVPSAARTTQGMEVSTAYLVVNVIWSLASAIAGGWLTARISERWPMAHALVLALIVTALSAPGMMSPQLDQPLAYMWMVGGSGIVGVLIGGGLGTLSHRRAAARQPAGGTAA